MAPDGPLVRSGSETFSMYLNYGSVAKLASLRLAVEALGPERVRGLELLPRRCVRWFWHRARGIAPTRPEASSVWR